MIYQIQFKVLSQISEKFNLTEKGDKLLYEELFQDKLFKSVFYFDIVYNQFVILYQIINSQSQIEQPAMVGNPLEERFAVHFYENQLYFKLLPCGIEKSLDIIEYLSLVRRELGIDLLHSVNIKQFYLNLAAYQDFNDAVTCSPQIQ